MYRELLTNKWVLSGISFLIVLSVACILWYKHDTAADKQAATEVERLLYQSETTQKEPPTT